MNTSTATAQHPSQATNDLKEMNFVYSDPALLPLVDRYLNSGDKDRLLPVLTRLGHDAATRLDGLAAMADKNPPRLEQFDHQGVRVDRIVYHPAYQELCRAAYEEYGLAAISHQGAHGWTSPPPHLIKYILSYVFVQAEFGLACPVSMTDAAARTLRKFGDPEIFGPIIEGLSSTDMDTSLTGAMFMTEIQGGTDIAKTATTAEPDGSGWRLTGKKWFASNPDADVILTLARYPGGDDTTRGIGMFMVSRRQPDGSLNNLTIDRLKDKMGTKSMPSGEVSLNGAYAIQVGQLDRGFRQMAEMVNTSRLSNAMRATALMRRAVFESVAHTRQREVFDKALFDQPLMRMTLLPMVLEAEAALGMVFYAGDVLGQADAGDAFAKGLIRVLTPLAKHYICKKARFVTGEAMEIRGGNGYIEDWVNSRLLRDAHLGSIWEGSSNVIALDVLRCMRKDSSHQLLAQAMMAKLAAMDSPDCAAGAAVLATKWSELELRGDRLVAGPEDGAQAAIGRYANELAQAVMATLLLDQASHEAATATEFRKLLVANTYISKAFIPAASDVPEALAWLNQIVDGQQVPREAARKALA